MTIRTSADPDAILTAPMFPSFDLHCHLRGTMLPSLANALAEKHHIKLPDLSASGGYVFSGFDDFLSLYDRIGHVIREPKDLKIVAFHYLGRVAQEGTRYVEFMISPGHSMANGIPFPAQISAISDAIEEAREKFNIFSSIIITCVRHRGSEEAMQIAELAASCKSHHVRGFGLTGNERVFSIEEFKGAFLIAEGSGLGLTAHAGEWLSASSVLEAVKSLNLNRVGHGISVATDPNVLVELAEMEVGFEICLSSNVRLGVSESFYAHPVRKMIDAGCMVSFSTDDPAYFSTTPQNELNIAIQHVGLSVQEQCKIFDDSLRMSFCNDATKESIRDGLCG